MSEPKSFIVKPEWRGRQLKLGPLTVGEVVGPMEFPFIDDKHSDKWIGVDLYNAQHHPTEAEARAAVEAAVMEALGGRPHE